MLFWDAHHYSIRMARRTSHACDVRTKDGEKKVSKRYALATTVPIMALFKMENPLDGAPSVAPLTPAW